MKKIKKWSQPKLIVLISSELQERVLEFCKTMSMGYNGPTQNYYDCQLGPSEMLCGPCSYGGS